VALATSDTVTKPGLRHWTDTAWFSRLLRHPYGLFFQPRSPHGAVTDQSVSVPVTLRDPERRDSRDQIIQENLRLT